MSWIHNYNNSLTTIQKGTTYKIAFNSQNTTCHSLAEFKRIKLVTVCIFTNKIKNPNLTICLDGNVSDLLMNDSVYLFSPHHWFYPGRAAQVSSDPEWYKCNGRKRIRCFNPSSQKALAHQRSDPHYLPWPGWLEM